MNNLNKLIILCVALGVSDAVVPKHIRRHVVFAGTWRDVTYSHCVELQQTGSDIKSMRMSGLLESMWGNMYGRRVSNEFGVGEIVVSLRTATPSEAGPTKKYNMKMVGSGKSSVLLLMNSQTNVIEHEYVRDPSCFVESQNKGRNQRLNRNGPRGKAFQRRLASVNAEIWRPTTASSGCVKRDGSLDAAYSPSLLSDPKVLEYSSYPISGKSANMTISTLLGSVGLRLDVEDESHVTVSYEDGTPVFADGVQLKKLDSLESAMYCNFDSAPTATGSVRRLIGAARTMSGFVSFRLRQVFRSKRT